MLVKELIRVKDIPLIIWLRATLLMYPSGYPIKWTIFLDTGVLEMVLNQQESLKNIACYLYLMEK